MIALFPGALGARAAGPPRKAQSTVSVRLYITTEIAEHRADKEVGWYGRVVNKCYMGHGGMVIPRVWARATVLTGSGDVG